MNKIRILIVDDSVIFRTAFKKIFNQDDIEVVGTASNGSQAVEMALELKPDIITMDVEMPVMNGLMATKQIMEKQPTKIILVSSLTTENSDETIKGLSYGALDYVHKVNRFGSQAEISSDVLQKIRLYGRTNVGLKKRLSAKEKYESVKSNDFATQLKPKFLKGDSLPEKGSISLVTIGISTGGPNTLADLIPQLSAKIKTPIVIVQHMPPNFTKSLADRLNNSTELIVSEIRDAEKLEEGHIYICPGGKQTRIRKFRAYVTDANTSTELYAPSYNVLLESLVSEAPKTMSLIMTGMGGDGTKSLSILTELGTYVVAQSPSSCVISGMPKSAIDAGVVNAVLDVNEIPKLLNEICV